jgi:hypothetical protein
MTPGPRNEIVRGKSCEISLLISHEATNKENGAVGARRPLSLLLLGLLRGRHRRGATRRRRMPGCFDLGFEFGDILLDNRSNLAR